MKSPFPGMDPYIEGHGYIWESFHHHLIEEIYRAISAVLPEKYVAESQTRAYVCLVEAEGKKTHPFAGDVSVSIPRAPAEQGGSVALVDPAVEADTAPLTLRPFIAEEYRETFLEIYELEPEWRLVTSIEVLSPLNKRRDSIGWEQYLRKRQGLLLGAAHFVEIDLLRNGTRMPMLDDWPLSPYTLLVSRAHKAPSCKVWPAFYTRPLPPIPVPLDPPHADIMLDLQAMLEAIYARSRYHSRIDYTRPLTPPLNLPEAAWLADRLRQSAGD